MISLKTTNAMLFMSVSMSDYLLHKHQRILNNNYISSYSLVYMMTYNYIYEEVST